MEPVTEDFPVTEAAAGPTTGHGGTTTSARSAASGGSDPEALGQRVSLRDVVPEQVGLSRTLEGVLVAEPGGADVGLRLRLVHEQGSDIVPGDICGDLDRSGQDISFDGELAHVLTVDIGGDDDTAVPDGRAPIDSAPGSAAEPAAGDAGRTDSLARSRARALW